MWMCWRARLLADHRLMITGVSVPGCGEAPGSRAFDQDRSAEPGASGVVLPCRAASGVVVSCQTLTFVSGLVRAHRREIGSVWRALNPSQQALLVLVYLRKGEPFAQVGAGFGVSTTTCWRYVHETVELLAQWAPKLRRRYGRPNARATPM